jgi:lysophospholipid acyltransferase (LPLAT)-like uncharacterized protein
MKERLLTGLLYCILRALYATIRLQLHDTVGYFERRSRTPFLVGVWHNRILILPPFFRAHRQGQRLCVLTSASRDGGLLSAVVQRFGLEAVRGSSSRRGSAALRELQAKLATGCDVIITPDGPRGPRYVVSPGLPFLAAQTGHQILRLHVEYARYWELKSWDRFRIPRPFSQVTISILPADPIAAIDGEPDLAAARERLAKELHTAGELEKIAAV